MLIDKLKTFLSSFSSFFNKKSFLILLLFMQVIYSFMTLVSERYLNQRIIKLTNQNAALKLKLQDIQTKYSELLSYTQTNAKQELLKTSLANVILKINPYLTKYEAEDMSYWMIRASKTYKIPLEILFGVIYQESHFNIHAKSSMNCIGLGQINVRIWDTSLKYNGIIKDPNDYYNISNNIMATAYVLRCMKDRYNKSWKKTLMYYYGKSDYMYTYADGVTRKMKILQTELKNNNLNQNMEANY